MLFAAATVLAIASADLNTLELTIDHRGQGRPISRLIYGANDSKFHHVPWTLFRFGGNAATTYNWENNYDNAGNDWKQSSGFGWSTRHTPESLRSVPAGAIINHHEKALQIGAESIVQVNLMGYVAADGDGPVLESEQAPSRRWKKVVPKKPGPFSLVPDQTDEFVYLDEFVNYLVNRFGPAGTPKGIAAYSLDNEPGLWGHTHPRAFSGKTPAKLLVQRSIDAARAIKAVDPKAKIHGFAPFGVYEYIALTGAPDWPETAKANGYAWFIDYYLAEFAKASKEDGRRLLDVLDLHFYVGGGVIEEGGLDAHLQSPRAMWDRSYREQSWLGEVLPEFFPLIPRINKSIARYYPGTKLCFSEWNTERPTTLPGALTTADMLGVFGQEGLYAATWWSLLNEKSTEADLVPSRSAFQLFRDYDGAGGTFGDVSLNVKNPRPRDASVYASRNSKTGELHLVMIGKRRHVPVTVRIPLGKAGFGAKSYGFGLEWGNGLKLQKNARVVGETLLVELPKQSACHVVVGP